MDKSGFSAACKQELEEQVAHRVADFKLDTPLREACEEDLKDSCAATLDQVRGQLRS
jgi:Golgi apparatus protein 1